MKSFFCGCHAKNNEEYRAVLRGRLRYLWVMLVAGIVTAISGLLLFLIDILALPSYQLGMMCGIGLGLALGSTMGIIRLKSRLSSEERLKESRLKETDERELEVNSKALRATARLILASLYVIMFVGGLFSQLIMLVCCLFIAIFLVSYSCFRIYYQIKM